MRLLRYLLPICCALAALGWWAAQQGERIPPTTGDTAEAAPPAAYPADFEARLGRLQDFDVHFFATEELPRDLQWQAGESEPEIGDPNAQKGGRLRLSNAGPYPAHFLAFGSGSPQFFHYSLFTTVELPLVERHPQTGHDIPGTAVQWARRGDTVFFRLHPAARYSNGRPLRAADYALGALLRAESGDIGFERLRAAAAALHLYGDSTLSLTLRRPLATAAEAAALLAAAEPGFYADFGSDYRERYAQRVPPVTGAYTVGRTVRGRLIELVRVPHWWARDLRYRRYTCNADAVEHHFLTDEAQAWEFLMRGEIDLLQTRHVSLWQQRQTEAEAAGLTPAIFCAEYPLPPYGIALNSERLPDPALRRGLLHAMDMDQAVALLFCGEAERLSTFHSGYGELSPRATPRCTYDPAAARAAFAEAGYTQTGEDGILRNSKGKRLSVRLTYTPNEKTSTLATVLVQSARRCGADIIPNPVPWQSAAREQQEGTHELLFWASVAPATPDPARFFAASAVGYDAPFRLRDTRMEALLRAYATAPSAERAAALAALDQRVAELAIWLPGWKENRLFVLHRPQIRFPRAYTPALYEAAEEHQYWIEP